MKKFTVRDEDNKEYEVEEIEEVTEHDEEPAENSGTASLSEDEIGALKKLASVADKLVALIEIEKDEHAEEAASEMLDEDEDEEVEEDDEEEIVDTDEETLKVSKRDSRKSVGAIERKSSRDSLDSYEEDVAQAWAKRYGGNK